MEIRKPCLVCWLIPTAMLLFVLAGGIAFAVVWHYRPTWKDLPPELTQHVDQPPSTSAPNNPCGVVLGCCCAAPTTDVAVIPPVSIGPLLGGWMVLPMALILFLFLILFVIGVVMLAYLIGGGFIGQLWADVQLMMQVLPLLRGPIKTVLQDTATALEVAGTAMDGLRAVLNTTGGALNTAGDMVGGVVVPKPRFPDVDPLFNYVVPLPDPPFDDPKIVKGGFGIDWVSPAGIAETKTNLQTAGGSLVTESNRADEMRRKQEDAARALRALASLIP